MLRMKLCYWLLLLGALTATCYSTELTPAALQRIVNDFLHEIERKPDGGTKQFSFLIALRADQCRNYGRVTYINQNEPHGIPKNPVQNIGNNDNYIATRPDPFGTRPEQKRCSEYKLLFPPGGNLQSPAVRFQANGDRILAGGGCVIFFTTNTPCTKKCFSNDQNCDIVPQLNAAPFQIWRNLQDQNNMNSVHQYFVYMKRFGSDAIPDIVNRFAQLANQGFQISRCNGIQCDTNCNQINHYCL